MSGAIPQKRILAKLSASTKREVLQELAGLVHAEFDQFSTQSIFEALNERENVGSTGIGEGIAIPHAKLKNLDKIITFFGRSEKGISFDAMDGKMVHLFFLMLAPEDSAGPYLSNLARISRFLRSQTVRERLLQADTKKKIAAILSEA